MGNHTMDFIKPLILNAFFGIRSMKFFIGNNLLDRIEIMSLFFIITIFSLHQTKAGPIAEGASKFLGNISTAGPPSNFLNYWNQVTLENNGKWENVEPNRGQFNWSPTQAAYDFCRNNKIPYKHHCFVWGMQYPKWMDNLSAANQKAAVENLIRSYGNKFPETAFIDVVNEAREKSPSWKTAIAAAPERLYGATFPVKVDYFGRGSIRLNLAEPLKVSLRMITPDGKQVFSQERQLFLKGDHVVFLPSSVRGQGVRIFIIEGENLRLAGKIFIEKQY